MKLQKENNIRLLVKDEQSLYSPFSPDAEFSEPVKSYIRSKTLGDDFKQQIKLTVISSAPLDEDRFRTAAANWVKDEKAGFEQDYKRYIHFPRAMFIIGVLIIILVSLLKPYLDPLTHAIILIIGTAVAGKGVVNWYEQVPAIRARKQLTKEIDKTSTIVFEYGDSQGSSDTHAEHDDHRVNA